MEIKPVADYHGPLTTKFGIPRQSGLIDLPGEIVFRPAFRSPDAVRGLEGFDRIWLIWEFSDNPDAKTFQATVRPPRLGGNTALGVFATRSPFRPNRLGLSCVELVRIDPEGPVLHVKGADLMDGTPIYDIKPYVPYAVSRRPPWRSWPHNPTRTSFAPGWSRCSPRTRGPASITIPTASTACPSALLTYVFR